MRITTVKLSDILSAFFALLFALISDPSTAEPINIDKKNPVIVMPLQSTYDFDGLEAGRKMALLEIDQILKKSGYHPKSISDENYEALWDICVKKAGGLFNPLTGEPNIEAEAKAKALLARGVAQETGAALVLLPRFVVKLNPMTNLAAQWDGVKRRVPHKMNDVRRFMDADLIWKGNGYVLSVAMEAFNPDGTSAFASIGGVSVMQKFDMNRRKVDDRTDLFKNKSELQEGLEIALAPISQ